MRQRDLASLDTLSRVANDLAGEFRLEPLLEAHPAQFGHAVGM